VFELRIGFHQANFNFYLIDEIDDQGGFVNRPLIT
jgi:hypothetical protein